MQILEDNIEDYGDLAKRIAVLREQVAELLEQKASKVPVSTKQEPTVITKIKEVMVESPENKELIKEIESLKKQLEAKQANTSDKSAVNVETRVLQKQIEDQKIKIKELQNSSSGNSKSDSKNDDDLVQEIIFLKKQIEDKEKTIKELGFKLEMLKMAKNLRSGALVNEKSDELKKIINEYIKELDKSIASLNIK